MFTHFAHSQATPLKSKNSKHSFLSLHNSAEITRTQHEFSFHNLHGKLVHPLSWFNLGVDLESLAIVWVLSIFEIVGYKLAWEAGGKSLGNWK